MYKEYLAEFWYSAIALENSKVSFSTPTGVRQWFLTIRYGEEVSTKGTLRKSLLPPRWSVNNWALKPNQPEEPPFTNHMLAICSADKPVKHSTSLKQPSVSSKEATKDGSSKLPTSSKTGHSKKRKESSSAIDSNLSQPLVSTPVDTRMHKEDQEVTSGLTYLGVTRKGASSIARQVEEEEASITIKLEDLAKLVLSVQLSFKDLDLPEDDPIIVVDDSAKDDEADEVHATTNVETKDTLVPKSSSLSGLLPTELKDLPSKFNELTKEVKGLKKQVHELEIELLRDLKEILSKLEDFTKTVTNLTSQVIDLKTLQWELLAEFLSLTVQVVLVQAKLKTLDALLGLLLNVTRTSLLRKPASIVALAFLIAGASQSRQHESRKLPTAELFNVNSGRISIVTVNTKEYHFDVLAIITRIMHRTLDNICASSVSVGIIPILTLLLFSIIPRTSTLSNGVFLGTDNQEKDEKQSQNDKTGLGMEKTVKDKAKSKPESQSSQKVNRKVNWSKSKSTQVNPGAKVQEI
ncbi:hypothetical protein Tco_1533238 [Tanacetum coccineum]